ncbi:hypothetical protein HK097_006487, partial [Rhizophlyctis rosea]
KCHTPLQNTDYFVLADQIFCLSHRDEIMSCHTCGKHIDGEVLIALEAKRYFHTGCFGCSGCGRDLGKAVFYEKGDGGWCESCWVVGPGKV